jgi:hypothetical protein
MSWRVLQGLRATYGWMPEHVHTHDIRLACRMLRRTARLCAVEKISAPSPAPGFIIHTGDLSHLAKPAKFDT